MIALRTTSPGDRSRVAAAFPDDLGGLVDLLPSLRTGEGLFVGEAMFVPSRVRVRLTQAPEGGFDPRITERWGSIPGRLVSFTERRYKIGDGRLKMTDRKS